MLRYGEVGHYFQINNKTHKNRKSVCIIRDSGSGTLDVPFYQNGIDILAISCWLLYCILCDVVDVGLALAFWGFRFDSRIGSRKERETSNWERDDETEMQKATKRKEREHQECYTAPAARQESRA